MLRVLRHGGSSSQDHQRHCRIHARSGRRVPPPIRRVADATPLVLRGRVPNSNDPDQKSCPGSRVLIEHGDLRDEHNDGDRPDQEGAGCDHDGAEDSHDDSLRGRMPRRTPSIAQARSRSHEACPGTVEAPETDRVGQMDNPSRRLPTELAPILFQAAPRTESPRRWRPAMRRQQRETLFQQRPTRGCSRRATWRGRASSGPAAHPRWARRRLAQTPRDNARYPGVTSLPDSVSR
jgi:hypothetical protein